MFDEHGIERSYGADGGQGDVRRDGRDGRDRRDSRDGRRGRNSRDVRSNRVERVARNDRDCRTGCGQRSQSIASSQETRDYSRYADSSRTQNRNQGQALANVREGSGRQDSGRQDPDRAGYRKRKHMDIRIMGVLCVVFFLVFGTIAVGAVSQLVGAPSSQVAADGGSQPGTESVSDSPQPEVPPEENPNAVQPGNVPGSDKASDEKVVYLTFDDGPSKLTPQVLGILDRYNAKATFFVVGHSEDCFYLIAEELNRGHTVGMHTYSHDYAQVYASDEAYFADLDQISQVVKEQIGYVPAYIRFPGGSSNSVSAKYCSGIMSRLVDSVHDLGFQYYDWNVSSGDGANIDTQAVIDNSTGHDDFNNIVLLCHDAATKQSTVDALPTIIEYYQERGYEFRGIDRESFDAHHKPQN